MDELRAACAQVATRARRVHVDAAAIPAYAASLAELMPPAAVAAGAPSTQTERERAAAYWLTLDAINFGSGWFPELRKRPGASGYSTIAQRWRERHDAAGPFTAAQLTELDAATVARVLGQDRAHELMALYAASLNDLGARLCAEHDGRFLGPVAAAGGSAQTFARMLGRWDCFADVSRYDELTVPFLKRAQIAAADLHRAGAAQFGDLERLTMFADNLVPHVLRLDGVLRFDDELVARIESSQLIEHDSAEEVEIRACALHAVELIAADLHRHGRADVTAAAVDELLWNRGQGPRYKAVPRHRSRCTAY
ncbi:MAG TPA: queuosine salvage family protein [Solirubrobacteraceae bacterium]|nr:queuosine salvage family protein [Solirubrobacteraceae bacterium]